MYFVDPTTTHKEGHTIEDEDIMYTRPEDAKLFVEETGVDALAVSIGTAHGQYKSKAKLSFEVLQNIHRVIDIPLVLHGGTGVAHDDLKKCIQYVIAKVNIGTEINIGWIKAAKREFEKTKFTNSLRNIMIPCNKVVEESVYEKILHLNSAGRVFV